MGSLQLFSILPKQDNGGRMKVSLGQVGDKGKQFLKKYFMDGQKLEDKQIEALAALPADASFLQKLLVKHRRLIGILIPLIFFETCWWCQAIKHDYFSYFPDRYLLSITRIFGDSFLSIFTETYD